MPRRPGLVVAALAGFAVGATGAHAAGAAGDRPLASQVGRATARLEHGIHKGSLVSRQAPGDPLGLIGAFQLDYALWTLLDEPVEDYQFRWELAPELRFSATEKTTLERLKRDEPDLFARLQALAPVSVTLRAHVRFYDGPTNVPFANADLDISPDLTAPSGRPQGFSVPGSPEWGAWFSNVEPVDGDTLCAGADRAACVRKVWARAKRVELTAASVIGVEWPEGDTRQLLAEIWARHHRADQKARDRVASDATFWSTPSKPPLSLTAAKELPTSTVAKTTRPFDKATRDARKARFQKNDGASFAVSVTGGETTCDDRGTIVIDVHGEMGTAAPAVVLDGKRLVGKAAANGDGARHTFTFPFQSGSHALEVDLAGPRPLKRRERVSCFVDQVTTACLGSTECPTARVCPCRIVK